MNKIKTILFFLIFYSSSILLSAQTNIDADTTFANSIYDKAVKFNDSAIYDSALVFYLQASNLFYNISGKAKELKNWALDKYFVCLNKQANIFNNERDYNYTISLADIVIIHSTKVFGGNNKYEADAYFNKAKVYYTYLNQNDTALLFALKRIEIAKILNATKHPDVAVSCFILGDIYYNKENYNLALEYSLKAANTLIELFGETYPFVSYSYFLIGNIYIDKGEYDLAMEYNLKSLRIEKELNGEKNADVADSYNNIGIIYWKKGQYDLALNYYLKALNIRKELFGETHPDVLQSYVNISGIYSEKGEFNSALEYLLKVINIREASSNVKDSDLALMYNNVGDVYRLTGKFDLAIQFAFKALNIRKELYGEIHSDVAYSYFNIGTVYLDKGDYDLALEHYFKADEIWKKLYGEKHPEISKSYVNIGTCYESKGQYDLALEYYQRAVNLLRELVGEKHPDIAKCFFGIGRAYFLKGDYDISLQYNQKALTILLETLGEKYPDVAASYLSIGAIYQGKDEYDMAIEYYQKALNIEKEIFGGLNTNAAMIYSNIGLNYHNKREYDLAIQYFQKSITILKNILGVKHPSLAFPYNNLAFLYYTQKKYDLALNCWQKGLIANLRYFNDSSNVDSNPIIKDYFEAPLLLKCLYSKAQAYYKLQNIKESLINIQLCDTVISQMRIISTTQSDKMTLGVSASQVYDLAIQLCINMANNPTSSFPKKDLMEQAFDFSEKNKTNVLLEALTGQESLKFAGIPDSLLNKEHELKVNTSFYEKKLAEAPDSTNEVLFRDKLFKLNRKYDELIEKFEKEYPEYYNLKYAINNPSVNEIQDILDDKTGIRSYFIGDSSIFIFTLTKNKLDVNQVPIIKNLNDSITWFRYGLTKTSPRMQEYYRRIGFLLYQQLFPESVPIDKRITDLIIIPDGALAIIPFESLLTSSYVGDINAYKEYPYLIRKYNISYSYSANLFYRTFSKETSSTIEITNLNDWLAFAPVFDNINEQRMGMSSRELQKQLNWLKTDSLMINRSMFDRSYITPLPATETETEAVFNLYDDYDLKAKVLLHKNANEQFIKSGELENYKALHFATHGFVNSERPELSGLLLSQDTTAGEDGILYSGEIYNLKLNADLVVLSACETGLGKIQKGEGLIGLTRALLYAGAKNIIVSLWQVADESTSDLMVNFYKNSLESKAQLSYSVALRNAKLKMISEGKYAHPLYWSPFILIGK